MRFTKLPFSFLAVLFFLSFYVSTAQPKIWATSSYGGNGGGMIYKIDPDGSNFSAIKTFDGDINGRNPNGGSLIKATDGNFYGVVTEGGLNDTGVIFRIKGSDKSFEKIFDFDADGVSTGKTPTGSLIQSNNGALYGMTSKGGASDEGVIYKINMNGTGFVKLVDFDAVSKGNNPVYSSLIQCADGYLYGIAQGGSQTPRAGVIFKMSLAGVYQKIFDFEQATTGLNPIGSLLEGSDGKLYGMTSSNVNNKGTIFKVEYNGTGFSTLHEFTQSIDGESPVGSLIEGAGGYLYGVTTHGGTNTQGVIFKVSKDGNTFQKVIDLEYSSTGSFPSAGLIHATDGRMYGATGYGGTNNKGAVFSLASDGTDFKKVNDLDGTSGSVISGALTEVDNQNFIAFCLQGGTGKGAIINANVTTSVVTKVFDFYSPNDGQIPGDLLQLPSGEIFGNTLGGAFNQGVIYKINPNGTGYAKLEDFDGQNSGSNPGPLIQGNDGFLYGMCRFGGVSEMGTIFKIKPDGTSFLKMFDFSPNEGGRPRLDQSLIQLTNGDIIGATEQGGSNGAGVIFKIKNDGSGYTKVFDFGGSNGTGPNGKLVPDGGGLLYGTTVGGGANGYGTIFKLNHNTGAFVKIYDFTQNSQAHGLTFTPNNFILGITSFGGSNNQGSIFRINVDGSGFQTLHSFDLTLNSASGFWPFTDFTSEINGFAYGLTSGGGPYQLPTLYKIGLDGLGFQEIVNFTLANKAGIGGSPIVVLDKQFQQITFSPFSNKTFGDASFNLSSTAASGLTTSYISTNTSVATINGNVVTLVGAGTTNIIAKQDGDATYFAAPSVIKTLTVAPNQTITFNSLPLFTIGDAPYTISTSAAFASSGLPLTFASSNTSVATISGNVITWAGAGTTTITATQAGNVNFSSVSVEQLVTVRPIPSIAITSKSTGGYGTTIKLLTNKGGSTGEVTYSVSNVTGSAIVTGDVLSLTGVGTVTITANVAADNNYGPGVNTQQITITKGKPIVQLLIPSICIAGATLNLAVDKGGSTGAVTYSLLGGTGTATLLGASLTANSSGTQLIKAIVSSDVNYNEAETIQALTILSTGSTTQTSAQFWGIAEYGGLDNAGVIFKTNSDGSGLTVQHDFTTSSTGYPFIWAEMMQSSNGKMYGVAAGGIFNKGILFEFDPSSATYTKLYDFFGLNGVNPKGMVAEASNGKLYGTTSSGGVNGNGILFEFDPQTKAFAKKFDFAKATSGENPQGLIANASGAKLYGTAVGGTSNGGVFYEYDPAQNTVESKIQFEAQNGIFPTGNLLVSFSGKIYGLLQFGGLNNTGVLYEFDPSDDSFTKLHDFTNQESGGYLIGSLSQAISGNLYGSIQYGGQFYGGSIFEYDINSNTYTKKFDLSYGTGTSPNRMTMGTNGNLYGTTSGGGNNQGYGVIFEYNPVDNTYTKKIEFDTPTTGGLPGAVAMSTNGKFYGLTFSGGDENKGTIFEYNPTSNVCVSRFNFSYATVGAQPIGKLTPLKNGHLFGISRGGEKNQGTLFEYDQATNVYLKKHDFVDPLDGKDPNGSLLLTDSKKIVGMTRSGGLNGVGTIYEYDLSTNELSKMLDLNMSTIGGLPDGGLMKASNGKFYGVASGGLYSNGTLFEVDPLTYQFAKKIDFEPTANGCGPTGTLIEGPNHKLYGVAAICGANNAGVLFEYDYSTDTFSKIFDFDGTSNGANPAGGLIFGPDGLLYGNADYGGANNNGVLFSYNPQTQSFSKLFDFSHSISGSHPKGVMAVGSGGKLYGMTSVGGQFGGGVLFELDPASNTVTKKLDLSVSTGQFPSGSLTLIKANQTISFSAIPDKSIIVEPFDVPATSTSGLGITYTSSNPNVATVSNGKVTIVGIGSTTITASQLGNFDYNPAIAVQQTLNVKKADQIISFDPLPNRNPGDPSFTLSATTTSGLTISYSSSDETVATISGNTLTIISPGSAIIAAKQSGDANYNAASDVFQTLTVNKFNQTITFNSLETKAFRDAPFTLSATSTSGLAISYTSSDETVAKINGITVTITGAGTTTITAIQTGNGNYSAAVDATQVLTVNKAVQSIIFSPIPTKTFEEVPFNLNATASSGLTIQYSTSSDKISLSGSQVTLIKPGSVTLQADQIGNNNYKPASSVSQTFCINPAKPTIAASGLNSGTPLLTSSSSTGNQWYKNGTLIADAISNTFSPTGEGSYSVKVTVDNCVGEMSTEQILVITGDIKGAITSEFFVYPNPVTITITINLTVFDSSSDVDITFYDASGKIVENATKRGDKAIFSVSSYSSGSYFIKASQRNRTYVAKFVKE